MGRGGGVSVALSCTGSVGSSCDLTASLSVQETLTAGKVTAIAARAHKPKVTHRTFTIGETSVTLSAGQAETVSVTLNSAGRQLLSKHDKLKALLTVAQNSSQTKPETIKTQTVSLSKPKPKAKKNTH